ncbi:hypothetical protein FACS1894166_07030 [Bacilli bacterium]|nr:hypothetical protein FACS1894166_07030 [Bacilli bacterium]
MLPDVVIELLVGEATLIKIAPKNRKVLVIMLNVNNLADAILCWLRRARAQINNK